MIRWGIIGAGNIAHRFVDSMEKAENQELYAVANRTLEKAKLFQSKHPCQKVYDSYEDLIADENVDAVYVAVPHGYHYENIIKALKKHKPVLCEKPAVIKSDDMKEIIRVAQETNTLFMEAMKTRFIPAYQQAFDLINQGFIGEVKELDIQWGNKVPRDHNYLFDQVQGGALYDVGAYNFAYIVDLFGCDFKRMIVNKRNEDKVDLFTSTKLEYPKGTVKTISAIDEDYASVAVIKGTKGQIICKPMHRPHRLEITVDDQVFIQEMDYLNDDFFGQIIHFGELLEDGKIESEIMTWEKSYQSAYLIERIRNA